MTASEDVLLDAVSRHIATIGKLALELEALRACVRAAVEVIERRDRSCHCSTASTISCIACQEFAGYAAALARVTLPETEGE